MNYLVLKFVGKPISKSNEKIVSKYPSKKTGRHYTYLSAKYKQYEKELRRQAVAQLSPGFKIFKENVWVSIFFHFKSKRHTDITNLPKSICDAMQGSKKQKAILFDNDKRVWLDLVYPIYNKEVPEGFTLVLKSVKKHPVTNYEKINYLNELKKESNTKKEYNNKEIKNIINSKKNILNKSNINKLETIQELVLKIKGKENESGRKDRTTKDKRV